MNTLKIIFTLLGLTLSLNIGFAQSNDIQQKADERVAEINASISSVDNTLALSSEQKDKIKTLHIKRTTALRAVKKSDATEEEKEARKTALIKEFNQEVNHTVLTKKQYKAKRESKSLVKKE